MAPAAIGPMVAAWERIGDAELYGELEKAQLHDGLPVVRPTCAALEGFIAAGGTHGSQLIGSVLDTPASAEAIALCVLLAGCASDHVPVLHACVRALEDPALNTRGVLTTTGSAAFAIIVNGPLRRRLGFNAGANCLGPGVRANAAVGRALSLITRFIGGAIPGETDMSTMGQPGKYTFCFAENEEESPWDPLHVERGFAAGESTVTLIGVAGTVEIVGVQVASVGEMLGMIAETMAAPSAFHMEEDALVGGGQPLVLISPEWAQAFAEAKLAKAEVQRRLFERARCGIERVPESFAQEIIRDRRARLAPLRAPLRIAASAEDILLVVAGGIGVKQTYVPNWNGRSRAVTVTVPA